MKVFRKPGLALVFVLCAQGTAFAHAHLLKSTPSAGMTVTTAPTVLQLDFSEGIQLSFTGITLRGPNGAVIPTGTARLAPHDEKELRVPLLRPLNPGQYAIDWHALSDDGHTTHGSYEFRVAH